MTTTLRYLDMHTAGEPVRIVTGGYPDLSGATILDKRRVARERHDHLRRAMMLEPRGHAGMYGVIPVAASDPEAAFGVLFTHNEGYSTMCGHATIALGRWVVESGRVPAREPLTRFAIEAPCGLLRIEVEVANGRAGRVTFESVPAFVEARDVAVDVPGLGRIICDIAYGGAYYAVLPALAFGLDFFATPVGKLSRVASLLTDAIRASRPIVHPDAADLGFLYGTIVTDGAAPPAESHNLCVFAEGQIDRSPTGSGVTARMALDAAKGFVAPGVRRVFRGVSGEPFTGEIVRPAAAPDGAVIVRVGGHAYLAGEGSFTLETVDPFAHGFALPATFGALARR